MSLVEKFLEKTDPLPISKGFLFFPVGKPGKPYHLTRNDLKISWMIPPKITSNMHTSEK